MMRHVLTAAWLLGLSLVPATGATYGPNVIGDFGVITWDLEVILDEEADVIKQCPPAAVEAEVSGAKLLQDAVDIWESAPQTNLSSTIRKLTVPAIDENNVCDFLFTTSTCPENGDNFLGPSQGGTNPIVYDEDGSIAALFFGSANRFTVLGFAGIVTANDAADASARMALKGEGVINLACLKDCEEAGCSQVGLNLSFDRDTAVLGFVLHELGHFYGMNHTQVNLDNDLQKVDSQNTPTMWAIYDPVAGGSIATLERDDEVGIADLYSNGDLESDFCTVSGTILDEDGREFQCANVVVRNNTDPHGDALSYVSGGDLPGGTAQAGRGVFHIKGLRLAHTYTLEVEPISRQGVLADPSSGIIPCNGGNGNPTAPSFDKQVLAQAVTCSNEGDSIDVGDIVVKNASKNVAAGVGSGTGGNSAGGCSLVRR